MAELRTYSNADFPAVKALWEKVFPNDPPWNRAEVAIPAKLAVQPELFVVALEGDRLIGTVMAGYDGHRGWLYSVAVVPHAQRSGVGTLLVREAERRLVALGCSKINLQVRTSNTLVTAFYQRLGYEAEDRVSMGRRLSN